MIGVSFKNENQNLKIIFDFGISLRWSYRLGLKPRAFDIYKKNNWWNILFIMYSAIQKMDWKGKLNDNDATDHLEITDMMIRIYENSDL